MKSLEINQQKVMILAPGAWGGQPRTYYQVCKTLVEHGYLVELVAQHLEKETLDDRITFFSLGEYSTTHGLQLFRRYQRNQKAFQLARPSGARLFHFFSPYFIAWGARLKKATGRPVIFDCREDYVSYALQRPDFPVSLRKVMARFIQKHLRYAASYCDAVTVADEGTAEQLRPFARRLVILHNFPRLSLFPDPAGRITEKPFDLVYHGGLPRYHLEIILAVDEALVKRGYALKWRFIGNITDLEWFTAEIKRRGIMNRFFITGMIPHNLIAEEVSKGKIGIIPLPDLPKFKNNIPTKLFEFMALRMPVVLSDLPASRPFIRRNCCAFMVPPEDYEAYASAIIRLVEDPVLCRRMGAQGRGRAEQAYNWELESRKLLDLYEELIRK